MKFIIYSGSYSINSLGATKSLCTKLVKEISNLGYEVLWVGRGEFDEPCKAELLSLSKSRVSDLLIRIKNKILRTFFGFKPNDISINEFLIYDRMVADKIKSGEIQIDKDTCFIGLGGMSLFSFQEAKRKGAKTVLASQFLHPYSHTKLLDKEYEKLGASNPIPEKRIERQLKEIEDVDLVWIFSDFALDSFLENGVSPSKLINSPLGVDLNYYKDGDRTRSHEANPFSLLFVGNVNPEKGAHILMESVLGLDLGDRRVNLVFNGNVAPYFKESFDSYREKLTNKGVQVSVEPGDPYNNYMKANLFILPSAHDSFGLVVLEAMASALPVIVSSTVGAKDCVREGENGFIFDVSQPEVLQQKIQSFLDRKELLEKFGQESVYLAKDYDWKVSVEKLVSEILNRLS